MLVFHHFNFFTFEDGSYCNKGIVSFACREMIRRATFLPASQCDGKIQYSIVLFLEERL